MTGCGDADQQQRPWPLGLVRQMTTAIASQLHGSPCVLFTQPVHLVLLLFDDMFFFLFFLLCPGNTEEWVSLRLK